MGLYVQDRTALIGGREANLAALRSVEQELAEAETKARASGVAGDATQIEASIAALFTKPILVADRIRGTVGSLSTRCEKADARTVKDCHQIASLRADLAAAAESKRHEIRATELRRQLRDMGSAEQAQLPILWPSYSHG